MFESHTEELNIPIDIKERTPIKDISDNPTINPAIFEYLPDILRKACNTTNNDRYKDVMLISSLTVISGALDNIHAMYSGNRVYPPLNTFIVAPSGTGKGQVSNAKILGEALNDFYEDIYDTKTAEYNQQQEAIKKKSITVEKPLPQPRKMSYIVPGSTTSARLMQFMKDVNSCCICETEADTVTKKLKSDHGDFSDVIRKAFTHEEISKAIKADDEFIRVKNPKLAICLAGTESQPLLMFGHANNAENGTLQRFLFYTFDMVNKFKSQMGKGGGDRISIAETLQELSMELLKVHKRKPIEMILTEEQNEAYEKYFLRMEGWYCALYDDTAVELTRRMALSFIRICMILTRLNSTALGDPNSKRAPQVECTDTDFNIAMSIMDTLTPHSFIMWERITGKKRTQEAEAPKEKNTEAKFMEKLSIMADDNEGVFGKPEREKAAEQIGISDSTAKRAVNKLIENKLIEKIERGLFRIL